MPLIVVSFIVGASFLKEFWILNGPRGVDSIVTHSALIDNRPQISYASIEELTEIDTVTSVMTDAFTHNTSIDYTLFNPVFKTTEALWTLQSEEGYAAHHGADLQQSGSRRQPDAWVSFGVSPNALGSGYRLCKETFGGLLGCWKMTSGWKGFSSLHVLHVGCGVSLGEIIPLCDFHLRASDTIVGQTLGRTALAS